MAVREGPKAESLTDGFKRVLKFLTPTDVLTLSPWHVIDKAALSPILNRQGSSHSL